MQIGAFRIGVSALQIMGMPCVTRRTMQLNIPRSLAQQFKIKHARHYGKPSHYV